MRDSSGDTYVALAADGLVAVVLGGKGLERGLNDATTETEDQVEGRLLWRVSVFRSFFFRCDFRLPRINGPSGCCSPTGCGHPQAACQRR